MNGLLLSALGTVYAANDLMAGMIILYAEVFGLIVFILCAIIFLLESALYLYNGIRKKRATHFTREQELMLDMVFLLFPTLSILYILVPTLGFIFNNDFSSIDTYLDVNVIGHQWYWSYEYSSMLGAVPGFGNMDMDSNVLQIDSFMDTDATINRLLEVTNRLVLPTGYFIGLRITAADVIHSFALPQLGVKVDAIPGRIAQITVFLSSNGIYRGQCSELCGAYHGFMPIVLESLPMAQWYDWYCFNLRVSPSTMLLENMYASIYSSTRVQGSDIFHGRFTSHIDSFMHRFSMDDFHVLRALDRD